MRTPSLHFGLNTRFSCQESVASKDTLLAIEAAKGSFLPIFSDIQDRHDPITVDIAVDGKGEAVSTLSTVHSRQKRTVKLSESTSVSDFWQNILIHVREMLPLLKSEESLYLELANQARDLLLDFAAAIEQGEYTYLGTETDGSGSQNVTLARGERRYALSVAEDGSVRFTGTAEGVNILSVPSLVGDDPAILHVQSAPDAPNGHFTIQPQGTSPMELSVNGAVSKLDWMVGLFRANGYLN